MNEFKKCSKCEVVFLKSDFHKHKNMKDGLHPHCKDCVNQKQKQYYNENRDKKRKYYLDNQDRLLNKQKYYNKENRDRINIYSNNRYKTDINYRLIKSTRRRIHQALNGKSKPSSTKEILGIDIDLYRKWIKFQMSPDMTWDNIEIDHVKPIYMFDVSDDEQLKEAFSWKNTQPLLKHDHRQKGIKFNFLDYQLQFIKAYQFIKLNGQEGLD